MPFCCSCTAVLVHAAACRAAQLFSLLVVGRTSELQREWRCAACFGSAGNYNGRIAALVWCTVALLLVGRHASHVHLSCCKVPKSGLLLTCKVQAADLPSSNLFLCRSAYMAM